MIGLNKLFNMSIKSLLAAGFALAACILPLPSFAQEEDLARAEAEARAILNEMSSAANKCNSISVTFTATYINKRTGDKTASKGSLQVKGDKYVLDVNDMVTYSNEKTIEVWQKKNNDVDISDHDADAEGDMTPSRFFGSYKSGYKLRRLGDKKIGGVDCAQIDLYPTDKKTNIMRIRLSINIVTKQVKQFEQTTKMGESLIVEFNTYKTNTPMDDKIFSFDYAAHKDVEVVDLR